MAAGDAIFRKFLERSSRVEVGDVVMFPSDVDAYTMKKGLLIGFHDNPSDVEQIQMGNPPSYCEKGPRKVADIFYKGKIMTCWRHSIRPVGVCE